MKIKFSGKGIAFLSHYMATNDIRYYLNGIYLAPMPDGPGVIGAATNGHALGMWRDPSGEIDRPAILTISKGLVTACKKPHAFLENRDGRLTCAQYKPEHKGYSEELYVQPNTRKKPSDHVEAWEVEGKFPDLNKPVPKIDDNLIGVSGRINPVYLALIAKSLADARPREKFTSVLMRQQHADYGILVLSHEVPEAIMVVMPMRGDQTPSSPWLEPWRLRHDHAEKAKKTKMPGQQPSDAAPPVDFKRIGTTGSYPA